jgi:putative ABC transport system permease protein
MSETTALPMTSTSSVAPDAAVRLREHRRLSIGAKLSLGWEIVKGGLVELWAHKLRSTLTLTLLMLGVFALVVMSSVLDGVMDKIATGFSGMSWDGTVQLAPDSPETTEEQKRFAMSPGLRLEDLPRLTAPDDKVLAYLPRATKESAVKVAGGTERCWVNGVWPDYALWMNRPVSMGRGLTDADERRRSTVAVVGATLGSKLFGGADPVGRDITVEGVRFRVVGVQAPSQIFSEDLWYDANGITIPLQTYMDRIDPDHKLSSVSVKLKKKSDTALVSATMIGRAKQAHHGIEDSKIVDLEAESIRAWANFLDQMRGWRVVLTSLAATVLLVGGVGVLSVMLISFSDRRYEIGLRKAMGASDFEILVQFLLEACVLAAVGASFGTFLGTVVCKALSASFPYGLVVNPMGLLIAWLTALVLAIVFGMYPAVRASRLSPMEAMR